ncbi:HotDog domain-containing protein [Cokeromyces recurvatus]|uniref:HotDog domain-containing protein n=1 Tax=Cokeromyces recurvatus TaxID=90255 RepID=UPI002221013E|nr:HotDog domain-containing protein [Cokeromyces recurvatus]KAI7904584.1 HotDog domain-containing protein [Cokeromyces recurvatus]
MDQEGLLEIVAQSLKAAWDTVPESFFVHSLHAYFILACHVEIPVIYSVQCIRDGKSFATRIVKATQRGKVIYVCSCSFAKPMKGVSLNHQSTMPNVADPDTLPSDAKLLQHALANTVVEKFPEKFIKKAYKRLEEDQPIDYRAVIQYTPEEIITGNVKPNAYNQRWFKTRGSLNDDMKLHACIIAYASDSGFLNTAATANGLSYNSESIGMMTSLDHTIWFHAPTRVDEWLLYDIYSPRTNDGRGVAFGRIYSRDGTLVATTAQEGVIRLSEHEQKRHEKKLFARIPTTSSSSSSSSSKL